ncbi:MAG: sodium ABC transporter ATP-binding protein [Firmicutes bacterium HGW-Firmicutes-15]|nr:MAG: sodium ABC transporter ATP-binding protein [Firmicutes bacterium HGW-Firmicutes-15]
MENILEVNNLSKSWPGFNLDQVSFSIPRGYIMGFIGPNGAGKTTTIKLIMNLIHKDSGEIKVFGQDHIRFQKEIRDRIGFVYDEGYFYEHLDIVVIKQIIAPFYSRWDEKAFQQYVREFHIPVKPKFKDLSRGEKMKFSLALALSHNAEFIIMDEPTSGLDPVFRNELLDILADLMQDDTKSILFSTHITSDLQRIADYICFIKQGKIVFCQDMETVLNQHIVVKGPSDILNETTRPLFTGLREHSFGFEAMSRDAAEVSRLMGDRVKIEKVNLEDIMLYTVRGDSRV